MKKYLLIILIVGMNWGPNRFFETGRLYAEPVKGGELLIARGGDSVSLDPAKVTDGESVKVMVNLFEGLIRYKDNSTEIEPCLALSWESSPDEKEWTFQLRKGLRFHDGTVFNAEAVVFSFMRQIDPNHPFYQKDLGSVLKYVKTVSATDEYSVRFSLTQPYAPFLSNLGMNFVSPIVSPSGVKKWGNDFGKHPVGTGPFEFVEWIPGERIVLKAASEYWRGSPFLDKVIFRVIAEPESRFNEFRQGRIDVIDGIRPADLSVITKMPSVKLAKGSGLNVAYLAMNCEKKPFDNIKVRQALNHAINKENLVKLIYQDFGIPAKNPIPPILWGYNDKIEDYGYDPEKAKELLKQAGYEKGFETVLSTMTISRPYMPQPEKVANAIKGNLSAVGIKVRILSHEDWKAYLGKISNGEHEMCLMGWTGDTGDPDNFLYVLLDKDNALKPDARNRAFFKNDKVHELLIQAQLVSDRQKRIGFYHEVQEIIHQQAPWVPLAHVQNIRAFSGYVHDIVFQPLVAMRFDKAWIEKPEVQK